jgi:Transposase DDE domain
MLPLDQLFDLFPSPLLDRLAVQFAVNQVNQVKLSGQTVFLCLLNALVSNPVVSQRLLKATYEQVTGESVDHSSFSKRLATINPEYFEGLFQHVYRQVQPRLAAGEERGLRLRRVDATTVVLSAKLLAFGIHCARQGQKGPQYDKRHAKAVFSLSAGGLPEFLHLCREQAEANDNPALGEPMIAATQPGDLWIVDQGLSDRERLLALHQRAGCFLVPHRDQALRVLEVVWEASEVGGAGLTDPPPPAARSTERGQRRGPAPWRLLRVEQAVFENRADAQSAPKQAKWAQLPLLVLHGQRWDERTQRWKPLVLLTNLPLSADGRHAGPYTFAEVGELYRLRWEIETFFKFLKQHLSYAHLTSHQENGIRVMIWMALIAAVLLIWFQRVTRRTDYWNVIKFWFAEQVRAWTAAQLAVDLAAARAGPAG